MNEQQKDRIVDLARECESARGEAIGLACEGNYYGESGNYRIMRAASAEAFRIAKEAAQS